jgi:hypothetical protein
MKNGKQKRAARHGTKKQAARNGRAAAAAGRPAGRLAGDPLGRRSSGTAAPTSLVGAAEPAPGGGGPAPLSTVLNGASSGPGEPAAGGRDRRGKFIAGNHCAKGNPANRRCAMLRAALGQDLGPAEMRQLGKKLFEQALAGDTTACRLLLEYTCGKPRSCPDEDALDLSEWKLLAAAPSLAAIWFACHEGIAPANAIELFKRLSAADAEAALDRLAAAVEGNPQGFARNLAAERAARAGR